MSEDVKQRALAVVYAAVGVKPHEETPLKELGVDSLAMLDLQMNLEDEFNLEISDSAFKKFKTAGDIVAYVVNATNVIEARRARKQAVDSEDDEEGYDEPLGKRPAFNPNEDEGEE
jgi:acyl carrier protein